jgi:hypothetical protein
LIPLDAVLQDVTGEYVYVKTVSGFKRRDIRIARYNSDYAWIEKGLSENEEIALSDPFLNKMDDSEEVPSQELNTI